MEYLKSWISQQLKKSSSEEKQKLIKLTKEALENPEEVLQRYENKKLRWWEILKLKGHNLPIPYRNLENPDKLKGKKWKLYFKEVERFIYEYSKNKKGFILVFSGRYGTGKTLMGAYLIARCDCLKVSAYYVPFTDLVKSYWGKYDELSEEEFKKVYDVLVIDEFQEINVEREEYRRTMGIIKSRFDNGKGTIIITNDLVDDVSRIFQAQVIDRLNGNGAFFVFDWQSFRSGD